MDLLWSQQKRPRNYVYGHLLYLHLWIYFISKDKKSATIIFVSLPKKELNTHTLPVFFLLFYIMAETRRRRRRRRNHRRSKRRQPKRRRRRSATRKYRRRRPKKKKIRSGAGGDGVSSRKAAASATDLVRKDMYAATEDIAAGWVSEDFTLVV